MEKIVVRRGETIHRNGVARLLPKIRDWSGVSVLLPVLVMLAALAWGCGSADAENGRWLLSGGAGLADLSEDNLYAAVYAFGR